MKSVEAAAPDLLRSGRVRLVAGNALDPELLAQGGPFDAIHVGAAAAFSDMVGACLCRSAFGLSLAPGHFAP